MNYFIIQNNKHIPVNDNFILLISTQIINNIILNNNNYCLLNTIYENLNIYAKKQNFILYNNHYKIRNLNTFIKKKYKSIFNFLNSIPFYKINNGFISKI